MHLVVVLSRLLSIPCIFVLVLGDGRVLLVKFAAILCLQLNEIWFGAEILWVRTVL